MTLPIWDQVNHMIKYRVMSKTQNLTFNWIPWVFSTYKNSYAIKSGRLFWRNWFHMPIGFGWYLIFNSGPEKGCDDEPADVVVLSWWRFLLTRPETEQEMEDRLEGEAEAVFMEREQNRYVEWSY